MKLNLKKALGITTGLATVAVNLIATATGANAATVTGCGDAPTGGTLTNEGSYCQLVFDTAGSHDWTLPTGITGLTALLVGGGGGSGPGYGSTTGSGWGYGGNGGDVVYADLSSETAGTVVSAVVGDGGTAAAGATAATAGSSSTVSVSSSVIKEAVGGIGDSGYGGAYSGAYYGYYGDGAGVNGTSSSSAGLNPKTDSSAPTIFSTLDYEYGRGGIVYQDTAAPQTIGQGGSVVAVADWSEIQGNGTAGVVVYRYNTIESAITLTVDKASISNGESATFTSNAPGDQFAAAYLDGQYMGDGPFGAAPTSLNWSDFGGCDSHVLTLRLYASKVGDNPPSPYWSDSYLASAEITFAADPSMCDPAITLTADKSSISNGEGVNFTSNAPGDNLNAVFLDGVFFGDGSYDSTPNPFDWSIVGGCHDQVMTMRVYSTKYVDITSDPSFSDPYLATVDVTVLGDPSMCEVVHHQVSVTKSGRGHGSVTNSSTSVAAGEHFVSTATAAAGSKFDGWVCTPSSYNTTNAQISFVPSADVSCVAKFSLNAPVVVPAVSHKSIKAVFYFSGDSSRLSTSTRLKLRAISKQLKAGSGVKVVVEGFVFKTQNTSNDRKLSLARARNVVAYLRLLGVNAVFSSNSRGIAKQHNYTARRAELVATWNLAS